jgi:NADH-quinone oxidoreductase subunit G
MGLRPSQDLAADLKQTKVAYIIGADPAGDSPELKKAVEDADFVVVQELHLTETAQLADVVLPVQAYTEREGTYTSGERRVQRFYPAVPSQAGLKPDFGVVAEVAALLELTLEKSISTFVFDQIAKTVKDYAELNYQKLAEVIQQLPIIGRDDVYYGGTSYNNSQGLGAQLPNADGFALAPFTPTMPKKEKGLLAVPVTTLLDQGNTMTASEVLATRLAQPQVSLHPEDADKLKVAYGDQVSVKLNGVTAKVTAMVDNSQPKGVVLVPRSLGLPISGPAPVEVKAI